MKRILLLTLILSAYTQAHTQRPSSGYMMSVLLEYYAKVYYDTPRQAKDLIKFIEDGDYGAVELYDKEYYFLKKHETDLEISKNDTAILIKTRDGEVFFHGPIYKMSSQGDGMRGRINFFDREGYSLNTDSLNADFREARGEVVEKYHPNWEPAPEEYERWVYRLAVFKATPDGLKPMFQEDSIDTTTDYYRDLEHMALKFLSDHSLGAIIFDSRVFQRQDEPHKAQFPQEKIEANREAE